MKAFVQMAMTSMSTLTLGLSLLACDPDGKKDCNWTLEPEPTLKSWVDAGFIPVCARNRQNMKQDCHLQVTLEYAKEVYGRKFRHVDLDKAPGIPHVVSNIKFCDKKM